MWYMCHCAMAIESVTSDLSTLPLLDLVPRLSPEFRSPYHLEDWCELFERAVSEPVRGLCDVPIRHYKSETTMAGIIFLLLKNPRKRIIFMTHSFEAAQARGKRLRQLAEQTPVGPERGWNTITDWRNSAGGGVVVMSAEQSKLGYDCHVLVFDDPLDEFGAMDVRVREAVDQAITHYTARCMYQGKPGPVLGVMSPWHPDDPRGRRLARKAAEWTHIHHAAIVDEGLPTERAFAPDVWDLPELKQMRAELAEKDPTERIWFAQLMCDPRPEISNLFGPATFYTEEPKFQFRQCYGADLAYTVGEGSDWFGRTAGRLFGSKMYLTDVARHKIDAHLIASTCNADLHRWGRAPIFSYTSGPEKGMTKVLRERGIPFLDLPARYNKLVRAQRTIKRWNDGDILIPRDALWAPGFIHRVACFRGYEKDSDDDEIDALVSMCDGYMGGIAGGAPKTLGSAYPGLVSGQIRG